MGCWVRSMGRTVRKTAVASCLIAGAYMMAEGGWIHAKAVLAQALIEQAWQQTLESKLAIKPWPWADTWPVAHLQAERLDVGLYVLSGSHGSALAFGPGHLTASADPGERGATILAGHRDTHFKFLQQLSQGDVLTLTDRSGRQSVYRVTALSVVDSRTQPLLLDPDESQLLLVTCYPFDAIDAGGPMRYVAKAVPEQTTILM